MEDIIAQIAEEKIREAMENGDFDNLPGAGKPLVLEDLSHIPAELRAGYILLKNAGVIPEEMELQKEMAALKESLAKCDDPEKRQVLKQKLLDKSLTYNILMERKRSKK